MPEQTAEAVAWAMQQVSDPSDEFEIMDRVREYFDDNSIPYGSQSALGRPFTIEDLRPYLPQ